MSNSRDDFRFADEHEAFCPHWAGSAVGGDVVIAARRSGKYAVVAAVARRMKEGGASAADIETITRALLLLGDMG